METIQEVKDSIETILDEIDEGLVEIENILLTPSELEDDNTMDCERQG